MPCAVAGPGVGLVEESPAPSRPAPPRLLREAGEEARSSVPRPVPSRPGVGLLPSASRVASGALAPPPPRRRRLLAPAAPRTGRAGSASSVLS